MNTNTNTSADRVIDLAVVAICTAVCFGAPIAVLLIAMILLAARRPVSGLLAGSTRSVTDKASDQDPVEAPLSHVRIVN